jgi:hypothetical protein
MEGENIGLIIDKKTYGDKLNFLNFDDNNDDNNNLIFLVFKENYFRNFHRKEKEEKRKILSSLEFREKIVYSLCAKYDKKDKTITIIKDCEEKFLNLLFKTLSTFFEDDIKIIVPYKESLIEKGFNDPHFCNVNDKKICLSKRNKINNVNINKQLFKYELAYMKSQKDKAFCSITIRLNKETIHFLKNICVSGVTDDGNGKTSQKEVFGKFDINNVYIEKGNITHVLRLDETSIIIGEDDNIQAPPSLYNFHSHPFQAYLKYKTEFGVPSVSDYMAVYRLVKFYNTIVHFVASLEGLYILSINPETPFLLEKSIKKIDKFCEKNFDYEIGKLKNVQEYIDKVNKHDFFRLRLISWEDLGIDNDIIIKFNKVGENCIIR